LDRTGCGPFDRPRAAISPHPFNSILPRCPELECVWKLLLPPAEVALAEARRRTRGRGRPRVDRQGALDEEAYIVRIDAAARRRVRAAWRNTLGATLDANDFHLI
jgi:hypothetical protein